MPEEYEKFLTESEIVERPDEARPFSQEEMVRCAECLRANPPTRLNCLYCGAQLPSSEAAAHLRRPTLRQPEKWEEGYNVILLERANPTDELLREVASLLRLERAEVSRILEAVQPLPLARLGSREEATLILERLSASGLKVLVVSDTDLMARDENLKRVRAFDFAEDTLGAYAAGSSEVMRAQWSDIRLLVTGRLIMRRVETEERRKGGGGEIVETRELAGDLLLFDLYAGNAASCCCWRVVSDSFDFSCLGAGKGLVASQNFIALIEVLRERAEHLMVDESYNSFRQALAPVWPPEERLETGGLRRERPGRFNTEAVMTSDNERQFTRYSRLRHFLQQRLLETEN